MDAKSGILNHSLIFGLLVVLMAASVGTSLLLHSSPVANNVVIFIIAFIMAGLVISQYMDLKIEGPLVIWLVLIPVILFAIIVFLMMPDIAHVSVDFLRKL